MVKLGVMQLKKIENILIVGAITIVVVLVGLAAYAYNIGI
ncbi:hypothetical protein APED_05740 [Acanthopleuribacter pedis]